MGGGSAVSPPHHVPTSNQTESSSDTTTPAQSDAARLIAETNRLATESFVSEAVPVVASGVQSFDTVEAQPESQVVFGSVLVDSFDQIREESVANTEALDTAVHEPTLVEASPPEDQVGDETDASIEPKETEAEEAIQENLVELQRIAEAATRQAEQSKQQAAQKLAEVEHECKANVGAPASAPLLQPAWEVDQFEIPRHVAQLFFDETFFEQLAERMQEAVNSGLHSMLVTSAHEGEGRSTVAIGVALAAAAGGMRVALVDCDIVKPTLIDDLCLDVEHSWLDAVRSNQSLGEVAVHGVEDSVTFFPLMPVGGASNKKVDRDDLCKFTADLKQSFDLVVVDGPANGTVESGWLAEILDSAMIVRDAVNTSDDETNKVADELLRSGIQGIGIVENFVV